MNKSIKRVTYKAFGLSILSEFKLPELTHIEKTDYLTDIRIIKAQSENCKIGNLDENKYFEIKNDCITFIIPYVGYFSIQNGNKILVSPLDGVDEGQLRLYILGTCMGVLLMQRRIMPLHGSAVAIDGKAYAIVGDSGAGKSTLARAFLRKGYQLLTDDVIGVSLSDNNNPMVVPSYPQQKLWEESLNEFDMKSENFQPLFDRVTKFSVPVQDGFITDSLPLAGIFELTKKDHGPVEMRRVSNLERFQLIYNHTYRNFLIAPLGLREWHFTTSAQLISKVEIFQVTRPVSHFTAPELASMILDTINEGVKAV